MISTTFQKNSLNQYQSYQKMRQQLISASNEILHHSKQAIFSLHRNDRSAAKKLLAQNLKQIKALQKGLLVKHPELSQQGAYLAALEEFMEAQLFLDVISKKELDQLSGVEIPVDQYIGGLCDMTGELVRQATLLATEQQFDTVEYYYEIVGEVIGFLIKFNLTGHLRQKFDDAKRNLKRLEGIRYDISLRG